MRRFTDGGACLCDGLGHFAAGSDKHLMATSDEMAAHGGAHDAEADKTEIQGLGCHEVVL